MKTPLLTMITTAALAATFGPDAAVAQDKTVIKWWYEAASPDNQGYLQSQLVDPFNAANPGLDLQIDFRGSELDKQLRVAMLSGDGPDIVYTPGPSYVASMATAGQLLPLDDLAAKLGWSDRILPVFLDLGRYDGKLYALPKTYETLGLFYNQALFDEKGWVAPKTIAELDVLAQAMLVEGIVPFAAGNADWRGTNEWYVSIALNSVAGPDNVYKALNGEIPWTAPPFVAAIEELDRWWKAGYFGPDYFSLTGEQAFAQIASRKAGMGPTGTWSFQNVPTYFTGSEVPAFVGFPSGEGVAYPIYALGIGSTFSISATSANPDGAAAAIDYIFSEAFYEAMNTVWQGEWNVPLRDLSNVKLGEGVLPLYTEAMTNLASAVDANQYGYTTWTFLPPATNTYLVSGIEEVWLDQITPEDYLAALDAAFQQERAEGKVPAIPARN
jgi:raffinose/stachyose/melibiose transport system substrate-binding protein